MSKTLGVTRTTNNNGAISGFTDILAGQGIKASEVRGGTLTAIESYVRDFGTAFYRLGIYQGGVADGANGDCSTAWLLWDSGTIDANGLSSTGEWHRISIPNVKFVKGLPLWIVYVHTASAHVFRAPANGMEDGSLEPLYFNTGLVGDETTPMPSTLEGATTGSGGNSDALKFILYYDEEVDTRTPAYIRRPRTKQPPTAQVEIDRTNPIARKLGFLWVGPHTGGPFGRDLVSGVQGVLHSNGGGTVPVREINEKGHILRHVNTGSANQMVRFSGLNIYNPYGTVLFAVHRHTDASLAYNTITAGYHAGGVYGDAETVQTLVGRAVQNSRMDLYDGSSSYQWLKPALLPSVGDGVWHTAGMVKNWGTGSGNLTFDGKDLGGSNTSTALQNNTAIETVMIAGNHTYPEENWGGDLLMVAWFTDYVSVSEFKSLHANPWQIFQPKGLFIGKPDDRRVVVF